MSSGHPCVLPKAHPPSRARPDAEGGGRARERLTPKAAEGVRGREGATRPVARQDALSLHLRGAKGALTLHLHCPKGALTLHLHRPKGKMRQKPPPRAGAVHKRARAPRKHARHNTKPPPTRQTATTAAAAARDPQQANTRDHWGDYTKRQFCKAAKPPLIGAEPRLYKMRCRFVPDRACNRPLRPKGAKSARDSTSTGRGRRRHPTPTNFIKLTASSDKPPPRVGRS